MLVIYCHPVAESFAAAAHRTVLQALADAGHEVTDVDLYAEDFDPAMSRQERLDYLNTARNERLVKRYDDQLVAAEALVLVYPAWWYGMPAMLKGYFDRVWLPGVAFDVTPEGKVNTERLQHIQAHSGGHHLRRLVVDGASRPRRPGAQVDRTRNPCAMRARLPGEVVRALQHGPRDTGQLRRFLQRVHAAAKALG